jgi:1-acyl-sn-glycerol-3-phosphate acyltransferase
MIAVLRTLRAYLAAAATTMTWGFAVFVVGLFDKRGYMLWVPARLWGYFMTKGVGIRKLEVIGRERIPRDKGVILMPNHESHLDPPTMIRMCPIPVRFVAKASLFRFPVLGWAMWSMGMIPIDRSNREKAFASIDQAAKTIQAGKSVLVFPEGTRTFDGDLRAFKKGGFVMAVRGGVPIVPVGIAGTRHIMPRGFLVPNAGHVVVVVGDPIDTSGYDVDSKEELMAIVRERISELRDAAALRRAEIS